MTLTRCLAALATALLAGGCLGDYAYSDSYGGGYEEECPWDGDITGWFCALGDDGGGGGGGGMALPPTDYSRMPMELLSVEVSGDFATARDLHFEPVAAVAYRSYWEADVILVTAEPSEGPPVAIRAMVGPGFFVQSMQPGTVVELDGGDVANPEHHPFFSFSAATKEPEGTHFVASPTHLVVGASPGSTRTSRRLGFAATFALDDEYGTKLGEQTVNLIFDVERD